VHANPWLPLILLTILLLDLKVFRGRRGSALYEDGIMSRTISATMLLSLAFLAITPLTLRAQNSNEKQQVQQAFKHALDLKAAGKLKEAIQELSAILPRIEKLYGPDDLTTASAVNY